MFDLFLPSSRLHLTVVTEQLSINGLIFRARIQNESRVRYEQWSVLTRVGG